MASVVTTEEINNLKRNLESARKRVAGDRQEAIRILHAAGICTRTGKLKKPYRDSSSK